jgi:acetyl esterase/lipase
MTDLCALSRRDFVLSVPGAAAMALLAPSLGAIAAGDDPQKPVGGGIDPLQLVDPELRAPLKAMPAFKLPKEITPAQIAAFRQQMSFATPKPLPQPPVAERRVPGRQGAPDVKVFVINAKPGERRPAVLHTHGGGFILGSAASDVPRLQVMARALDCVVVTVEYRLAPETPFPGSLEDNYAALKWLHAEAKSLGVDPARIAVAGESAGGGHAAILAIAARDRGEVPLVFQSLVYPMLDDRTGSSRQVPPYIGAFIWTAELNRSGWKAFHATEPGGPRVPAGAVPARLENLAGLPPAWIGTGSVDLFVNEDIEYARRLVDAGVRSDLLVVGGGYHGFDLFVPNASVSKNFTLARYNALARAFGAKQLDSAPSG